MSRTFITFVFILILTAFAAIIALPEQLPIKFSVFGRQVDTVLHGANLNLNIFGQQISKRFTLKQGLDIRGGIQVVLEADMSEIPETERETAIEAAREVIARRVDLYGVSEPLVQTSRYGDSYRIIVELAGVDDPQQALELIGTTAQLEFKLYQASDDPAATQSAAAYLSQFQGIDLTGQELQRSVVQFDPQTGQPVVGLEFTEAGRDIFAEITQAHTGEILGIFLDEVPLMMPQISTPILDGQAVITGDFSVDEAKQLSIQLNAGALPVPITVLEQRTVGASLGQASVQASIRAGLIGLGLVMLFMIMIYGVKGVLATLALAIYSLLTIAIYKVFNVTLTLPGIAGLLLSIGMAVDANILIFERMKEEVRKGFPPHQAIELGFGRAWDSIKDANLATIVTALILINPFNLAFLNTSGLVKGFGITLLIGVLISLFTGVVVTRTLMRLFLAEK